jgi:uncharacterized protein
LVKVNDLSQSGDVIDSDSEAGANSINSIQFTVSDAKQKELQSQALTKAAEDAKIKAQNIASSLGVRLVKPTHISEGFVSVLPFQRSFDLAEAATEIAPGDVSASATLSVVYEIA